MPDTIIRGFDGRPVVGAVEERRTCGDCLLEGFCV